MHGNLYTRRYNTPLCTTPCYSFPPPLSSSLGFSSHFFVAKISEQKIARNVKFYVEICVWRKKGERDVTAVTGGYTLELIMVSTFLFLHNFPLPLCFLSTLKSQLNWFFFTCFSYKFVEWRNWGWFVGFGNRSKLRKFKYFMNFLKRALKLKQNVLNFHYKTHPQLPQKEQAIKWLERDEMKSNKKNSYQTRNETKRCVAFT